ncbi:MAG: hypothetical protein PHY48_11520 [Candidatus Cloacimonetes bacterium]|nr:hypothetical protein [Candidatus Cloacimonadota bacterium]
MFERTDNQELKKATNDVIRVFGVREEVLCNDLQTFLRTKDDVQPCVQQISSRIGLSVRIELFYVSQNFKAGNTNRFKTKAMVRSKNSGQGSEGIIAQVEIPSNLPIFGSDNLNDYPVKVYVSENCYQHPQAFIVIMLHELSHVLLASLLSPYKDCELHTDLVPIVLGFREAVRSGRKVIESRDDVTTTTTYGYLTELQFELACNYVTKLLKRYSDNKEKLSGTVDLLNERAMTLASKIIVFRECFNYLNVRPPQRMKKEHGQRVVELHSYDHAVAWDTKLMELCNSIKFVQTFISRIKNHYTSSIVDNLNIHTESLKELGNTLYLLEEKIETDIQILQRYIPVLCRFKKTLFGGPLIKG